MSKAILGLFLSMVVVHPARAQAGSPAGFPMKAGTFWIYRGTVKWSEGGDVREQQIDWKVEVTRYAHVGDYEVAVVKGDPGDLVWYQSGKPRGDYLLVREGSKYYRVAIGKNDDINELLRSPYALSSRVTEHWLIFELPLHPGVCFGRDPEDKRDDVLFCWIASQPKTEQIKGVKGISESQQFQIFTLSYRDNTAHEYFDFVPGIGKTSYFFGHHGSVSEVDVHLVEYEPGR